MTSAKLENYMFPRPGSPTKEDLRPNAHPYPIKTTSTGVLSRHNSSSSFGASQNGHHYVPSPSPSPSRASPVRKMNGHGHRYSRSLSSDGPRPLPIPPPSPSNSDSSPTRSESPTRTQRSRRADTLPTPPGGTANPRLPALDELPSNPKAWTPSQLSLYISTTLRVRSGETLQLPAPVAQDIANFVRESKITGRSFLRMKEEDLEQFDINKLWRSALLSASRSLRQSVLKGRIWGFGSIQESPDSPISTVDDDDDTPHKRRRSMSLSETRSHNPFVNGSASSSVEDLSESSPIRRSNAITGRFRNGRVKGMVESFERSGSVDEGMSDGSVSRRERSNSNVSNGSSIYDTAEGTETDTYANATARPSSTRPLPAPPAQSYMNSDDELSMDELLQRAGILPTSSHPDTNVSKRRSKRRAGPPIGVHAWETEPEDRVTVKRVMPIPGANLEDVFVLASPDSKVDVAVDSEPAMLVTPFDEHRLEQEIEETKMLVKKLRRRIEVVEKRVSHMEARELEREEQERACEVQQSSHVQPAPPSPSPPPLFPPGSLLGRVFSRLFGSKALSDLQKSKLFTSAYYQRLTEPTSLRGIPSYVFLVGLGVCAVVFKVLVRKGPTVRVMMQRR